MIKHNINIQLNTRRGALVLLFIPVAVLVSLGVASSNTTVNAEERELNEYEVQWTQYPAKNTARNKEGTGSIIWGGGSFLKLISKLSIEGCNVNAIAIYKPGTTEVSHLHHFQAPDFVNPTFSNGQYMKYIPKGSPVAFTCVDICDILVGPNQDYWEEHLRRSNIRCQSYEHNFLLASFALTSDCTDDFTEEVKRHFFTRVPIFQDTCIAYFSRKDSTAKISGVATQSMALSSQKGGDVFFRATQPIVLVGNDNVVWNGDDIITDEEKSYMRFVKTIMHELCHQQQSWYVSKFYETYDMANQGQYMYWEDTQAGKELIQRAEYVRNKDGKWVLEEDSPYHNGGYNTPTELAAYVCAGYLTEKIYNSDYPETPERTRAIPRSILTPEMREWVQEYMIIDY